MIKSVFDNSESEEIRNETEQLINHSRTQYKPIWRAENSQTYKDNISSERIDTITDRLDNLLNNIDNVTQLDVDQTIRHINETFRIAAEKSNMLKQYGRSGKSRNKPKKKFFDRDCQQRRADYRRAKRYYRRLGTDEARAHRNAMYNIYKTTVNRKSNQERRERHRHLRRMKSTDAKIYWRLLKDWSSSQNQSDMPTHEEFVNHFESLGNVPDNDLFDSQDTDSIDIPILDTSSLNKDITLDEIKKHIRNLKNNKACGYDLIINEFLKVSSDHVVNALLLAMNLVLKTGFIPEDWTIGTIRPLYKGKGNVKDVDNYRGITLLSCYGKLFTSILNDRLYSFLDDNGLLGYEQGGYRKGHSTTQHIFSLHSLINLYLQKKKKLYCLFVDYRKAYDKIQRNLLWDKLLKLGIQGKIVDVVKNLYIKAKSCVKTQLQGTSDFFSCNLGLRQGENLSPILFSIFLNDLKTFMSEKLCKINLPANLANNADYDDIEHFLYLFILLYADDTAILSESPKEMQQALNVLHEYCVLNGLSINVDKTKVLVFSRGKIRNIPDFNFNGERVDVVFEYKYLGTVMNYNNRFLVAIKAQCLSASKAIFSLLKKSRKLDLPIDIQLDLFDKCIAPILLYGSEVWAFETLDLLDREQLRYYKMLLGVKSSTPTCMVLGEIGKYPVSLYAKSRLLSFWYSQCLDVKNDSKKISSLMLRLSQSLLNNGIDFTWLNFVHDTLNSLGLTYIWQHVETCSLSLNQFKKLVLQRLKDQFLQTWNNQIQTNEICINYRIFKTTFVFEQYLISLPTFVRRNILKFRLCSHKLPIQQLRYINIPRHDRVCTYCNKSEVGDEYHYLFICDNQLISNERQRLLSRHYYIRPNTFKYEQLFTTKSRRKLIKLGRFVGFILGLFR